MPSDSFLDNRIAEELPYGNDAGKFFSRRYYLAGLIHQTKKKSEGPGRIADELHFDTGGTYETICLQVL